MALRADVELLNNSLNNLGGNALARRKMQQEHDFEMQRLASENQMRQIQEARYNAQGEHFNRMESAQQGASDKMLGNQDRQIQLESDRDKQLERQIGLKQAVEDFKEAQGGMAQAIQHLGKQVKAGGMSTDEATAYFKGAMDKMPPQIHDKMLQNPQYASMYDGKVDWASLSEPPKPTVTTTPGGQELITDNKGHVIKGAGPEKALPPDKESISEGPTGTTTNRTTFRKSGTPAPGLAPTSADFGAPPPAGLSGLPGGLPGSVIGQPLQPVDLTDNQPIPGGGGLPVSTSPAQNPPASHIQYLKANAKNPKVISDFEAKYGPGSAAQYLGQ